ncbi:hypothetical protein [Plebeiibacterium marinum]|uniref:Transposase IS200-like domain-containing protein n=1 Tax=Plebeiibacterium marinum TaxID=2992111 RepID=A0AAE3MJ50_9BACT|nr:hypothetical protein [Plebeiobacterium marinum]MCW3808007.1 hypothetical protein [Plebeiobacterium marinum]
MHFQPDQLYHIYNQGNNRQKIFFTRENYLFFLDKIHKHILPYCDVLAWCLMPNHFHLMVKVNSFYSPGDYKHLANSHPVNKKHLANSHPGSKTLNNSIAIILRSYTRAINIQEKRSGSLFRQGTKAKCLTLSEEITPAFRNTNAGTIINTEISELQYPQVCFEYIHQNPVKAGLVNTIYEWEYSSAKDIAGTRNGKLINRNIIEEYGLVI